MHGDRPYILTIAGLDPSGGAGILADIKTFESHKVYGLAIPTCLTHQTENGFYDIEWRLDHKILDEIGHFLSTYPIKVVKIGVVPSFELLEKIIDTIRSVSVEIAIVVDPVLSSTSGYTFISNVNQLEWLKKISLLTPNYKEIQLLGHYESAEENAMALSHYCHVLLKGGHNTEHPYIDQLYFKQEKCVIEGFENALFLKNMDQDVFYQVPLRPIWLMVFQYWRHVDQVNLIVRGF